MSVKGPPVKSTYHLMSVKGIPADRATLREKNPKYRTDGALARRNTRQNTGVRGKIDTFAKKEGGENMNFLTNYLSAIITLCKKHKVSKLFAFGSVLTNRFTDKSDVDLIVEFHDMPVEDYADNYLNLKDALSSLFHRKIDLLEDKAIRNPIFRRHIDNSKQLIYG